MYTLNEALYSGPSLLCMIFDILLQFRLHEYILLSDIKQAFLNVRVRTEDSDLLRFLRRVTKFFLGQGSFLGIRALR